MFESIGIEDLDARQTSEAIAAAHRDLVAHEAHRLRLTAHWLDLHAPHHHPDHRDTPPAATSRALSGTGRLLPGTERMITSGADGTAMVAEFAAAEFAALQDIHPPAPHSCARSPTSASDTPCCGHGSTPARSGPGKHSRPPGS